MKGMGAVAAAAKFKSKAKKSKSSSGWIKRASTSAEIDASVSPLAAAITQEENEGALVLLREAGLSSVIGVEISQTVGERYTGGASCPVYKLRCVLRDRELYLVAKVVIVNEQSDERQKMKCRSNRVESRFYQATSTFMASAHATIPELITCELPAYGGNVFTMVMTDLSRSHPAHPQSLTLRTMHAALRWLARLHASFWGLEAGNVVGLWEAGSYWSVGKDGAASLLDIAPRWAETMKFIRKKDPRLGESPSLKALGTRLQAAALPLDRLLRGDESEDESGRPRQRTKEQKRFRTIIHGDAKAANMFFTSGEEDAETEAAMCDFQFAGEGYGALDLAYLLFPDARANFLECEEALLDFYHTALVDELDFRGAMYDRKHLALHYKLARLDYFRHHVARSGFVACSAQDIDIIRVIDRDLSSFDGGTVRAPAQYESALAKQMAKTM